MTITGTGSITINTTHTSILSKGDMIITGGVITATSADESALWADGGAIRISDTANVTATSDKLCGLRASGTGIYISGGTADITSTADSAVYTEGVLEITGSPSVTTIGFYCGLQSEGNMTLSGGTISATSTDGNAIYTGADLNVNGGNLTAMGGAWCGLKASGDINISGGMLNINSPKDTAIYTPSNLTIGGTSNVTAYGTLDAINAGGTLTVSDNPNITATSNATVAGYCGLNSTGTMTIGGGTLNITSATGYAILTTDSLMVNGTPNITAVSNATDEGYCGLYASKSVTINGGILNVTSLKGSGIHSQENITVGKTSHITAVSDWSALNAVGDMIINGTVVATANDSTSIYAKKNLTIGAEAQVTASSNNYNGLYGEESVTIAGTVEAFGGVTSPVSGMAAGIVTYGTIDITGGRIHAKGAEGESAIIAKQTQIASEAPSVKITISSPLTEKFNGKIANSQWNDEDISWTTFIAKEDQQLTLDSDGFVANALDEVWIGDYHDVTISGIETNGFGTGRYAEGESVSIHAGTKSGHTFSGWTATPAVTFANAGSESTTFIMPADDVVITAYWTASSGGGSTAPPPKVETSVDNTTTTGTIPLNTTVKDGSASATISGSIANAAIKAAQERAEKSGIAGGEIVVAFRVESKNADTITTNLPLTTQKALINNQVDTVLIQSDSISISFNLDAIKSMNSTAKANISIVAQKTSEAKMDSAAASVIGDRAVFDISAFYGQQKITNFNGNNVTITLPYTLRSGENGNNVHGYFINDAGKAIRMENSRYNSSSKTLTFKTSHFSNYAVGYDKSVANANMTSSWSKDSSGNWYYTDKNGVVASAKWVLDGGKWYYIGNSTMMYANRWHQHTDGNWYYLGASGAMATSRWIQTGSNWYYVNASGVMLTSTTTPDGYRVNSNGAWVK